MSALVQAAKQAPEPEVPTEFANAHFAWLNVRWTSFLCCEIVHTCSVWTVFILIPSWRFKKVASASNARNVPNSFIRMVSMDFFET